MIDTIIQGDSKDILKEIESGYKQKNNNWNLA
jgi:hypothetical protein